MHPATIEIANRQVRIRPGHEFDQDVLLWIHSTFPYIFRYLSEQFHNQIMTWVQANITGIYMTDIDPQHQGTIWFADPVDAEAFEEQFKSDPRFW
jgi:hypothetical protein